MAERAEAAEERCPAREQGTSETWRGMPVEPTIRSRGEWHERITVGYVLLIAVWLALRLVFFDGLWWLALLNTFALALFLPLIILFPLALWRRRPWLLVGLAVPIAAFVWLFGNLFLPGSGRAETGSPAFTAVSFNVLWSNQDYGGIAQAIATASPDIVALQELRPEHLPAIKERLGGTYPHQAIHPVEQFHSIGLLSRFPIKEVTPLADPPFERALLVRLRVAGRPLAVIVAHLTPTNMLDHGLARLPETVSERYTRRGQQAAALLETLRRQGEPAVVLCDCNFTDTSEAYTVLNSGMADSFAEAGWGLGHTMLAPGVAIPAQRLDYIWHTAELQALAARVGPDGGSDHLPIVAQLVWR